MALKPIRQTGRTNICYITPWTQERGGILSVFQASGMYMVEYAADPSGTFPVGFQLNDVEHINLTREYHPQRLREVDVPCAIVGVATQGLFETDWLHLVGDVVNGDPAYLGPSGTITNSNTFGSSKIGQFAGRLQSDPHTVVFRGLGFTTSYMDTCTKEIVTENDPADQIKIASPGFIRIRINPIYQNRG